MPLIRFVSHHFFSYPYLACQVCVPACVCLWFPPFVIIPPCTDEGPWPDSLKGSDTPLPHILTLLSCGKAAAGGRKSCITKVQLIIQGCKCQPAPLLEVSGYCALKDGYSFIPAQALVSWWGYLSGLSRAPHLDQKNHFVSKLKGISSLKNCSCWFVKVY